MKLVNIFQENRKIIRLLSELLLLLGCVSVFYLCSIGPSYRALRKGNIQQSTFNALYDLIVIPVSSNDFASRMMYRYLNYWYDDQKEVMRAVESQLATNGITRATN